MFRSRSGVRVYSAEAGAESESKISESVHLWHTIQYDHGQDCRIFFVAYGQNPNKNGQNGCFLKTLWQKSQRFLIMVISIFIVSQIVRKTAYFLPKKCGFSK